MASVNKLIIDSSTVTASGQSKRTSSELYQKDYIAVLKVSAIDAGTVDVDIQESADGQNWSTLVSFTQVAGAPSYEAIKVTDSVMPNLRADYVLAGGATSVDAEVFMLYDKQK